MRDVTTARRRRTDELGYLWGLADPEFFTHWAAARTRLALTSSSSPGYSEIKDEYDALAAEYRRRLDGAPHELTS
jgi:hypothetical protein